MIYDLYACVATSASAMALVWADTAIVYMLIFCLGIFSTVSPSISRDCTRIVLHGESYKGLALPKKTTKQRKPTSNPNDRLSGQLVDQAPGTTEKVATGLCTSGLVRCHIKHWSQLEAELNSTCTGGSSCRAFAT